MRTGDASPGVEVELGPPPLLVEGPAADLRIAGRVHIKTFAPGPGIPLQFQQCLHCLVISLEGKAGHQIPSLMGAIRFKQSSDQPIPYIIRCMIVEFAGPEYLRGQRCPLDLRGDGIPVTQQLPEVGAFRVLHFRQPLNVLEQVSLLLRDLLRRPGERRIPTLFAFALPAQSVIAQRSSTAGAGVF